jgi:hypothetical protein
MEGDVLVRFEGRKVNCTRAPENFVGFVDGCHLGFAPAFVRVCYFGGTAAVKSGFSKKIKKN